MDASALRSILECMSEGVVVVDAGGKMVFLNPAAKRLVGFGLTDEPPEAWSELYGLYRPDGVTPFPTAELPSTRALRGEAPDDIELYVKNAIVGGRHLSVGGRAWRDSNGELLGAVVVVHDIAPRRVAEEELRKHRRFLESIVEEVPLMIFVKEAKELRFERFNRAGETLLGIRRASMIGKNDYDFFPKEQADFFTGRDRETLKLGKVVDISEEPIQTAAGERWLHTRKVPILDEQGQPSYLLGISEDITERKMAAEALRASNEQLEQRVRERTKELERANEILREEMAERRKAEEALRATGHEKDQFLAMLSHELRNPLAPMRNSLHVLEHAPPDGDQALRARAVLERQVTHMTRLVDDLLDVSRIAHGKVQLQKHRLDLDELTQRTVDDLRSLFTKNDITLEMKCAVAPVWVNGDSTRLAQVVGNLLTNAAKFTPRGGKATITVRSDAPQNEAVLIVADTGSGIAPELLPHLFEPFSQADKTLDRSKGGLGLGLALVKGLIELHQGVVRVESNGGGTTFTIRIPLAIATETKRAASRRERRIAPRRILVIEDNHDAADSLRDALELDGHIVEIAYDGVKGLAKAHTFKPDIVLCDIGLPGLDGYELARTMRRDPELAAAALVALTGYAQPDDVATAKDAGFDEHLAKPPTMKALEDAIARAVLNRTPPER